MNEVILSLFIIFGMIILTRYFYIFLKARKNFNYYSQIWTNQGKNKLIGTLNTIYKFMIILSFIAGIYIVYYLVTDTSLNTSLNTSLIYSGSVIFLVFSTFWALWPFKANKIVLFLVSVGVLLLLVGISLNYDKNNIFN